MKKADVAPLMLLIMSLGLMFIGIVLKSMVVIAGVTGLVLSWFLCIDCLLVNHKMPAAKKIIFALAIIGLPVCITMFIGM